MNAQSGREIGAYAEFADDRAVQAAVREMERVGIPRDRILIDAHAPDQSPTPMDTQTRDKRTIVNLWQLGGQGALLGFVGGGILGAVVGSLVWSPMSPAWVLLAVGFAVFGIGLGLLWSLMIRKGEGSHLGTVYDEPAAHQPTAVTVRPEDPDEVDELLRRLEAAGGANLRRVPKQPDKPER